MTPPVQIEFSPNSTLHTSIREFLRTVLFPSRVKKNYMVSAQLLMLHSTTQFLKSETCKKTLDQCEGKHWVNSDVKRKSPVVSHYSLTIGVHGLQHHSSPHANTRAWATVWGPTCFVLFFWTVTQVLLFWKNSASSRSVPFPDPLRSFFSSSV